MKTVVKCKVDSDGNIAVEVSVPAMRAITKAVSILNAIAAVGGEQCKECGEAAQAVLDAVAKVSGEEEKVEECSSPSESTSQKQEKT